MREVRASLELDKPLVLTHEQREDKGGAPLDALKAECSEDLRAQIFDGRTPITWHRILHYQNLSLKLIATEMLRHGPKYRNRLHDTLARHSSRESVSARQSPRGSNLGGDDDSSLQEELSLVCPGEVSISELALSKPVVLWCSAANPGAAEVAKELKRAMGVAGAHIQVVDSQPDGASPALVLLYLNKDTWVQNGKLLECDVRAARGLQARPRRLSRAVSNLISRASTPSSSSLEVILVHETE